MTIGAASSFTGATTISNGEIALSGSGRLANSSAVNLAGATARYDISAKSAATETNGSLAGVAGSVVNLGTNKTLNVGGDNTSTTFAGVITNTGALIKSGAGTMTLSGANTFSGGSTLSAGVIRAANSSALGTGALVASAGTVLEVTNGVTLANNMSLYTVRFLNGGNTLSGTITNNNTVYDVASGTTNTVSGFVTGAGGVELIGGGQLNITGATNNYTGNTVISNGTLQISTLANSNTVSSVGVSNNITLAGTANSTNANSATTAAKARMRPSKSFCETCASSQRPMKSPARIAGASARLKSSVSLWMRPRWMLKGIL
jgi:autotransporter-associated beta strand protein